MWAHRIVLESLLCADNAFVTLTYDSDQLMWTDGFKCGCPSLYPADLRNWLKRLRKKMEPMRIRYFAVGEYGDVSFRPHYHVALFGYPSCRRGISSFGRDGWCCEPCQVIRDTWSKGNIVLGNLSLDSAQYIAGYVVKKMTRGDDERLSGRYPEFARMSSVPGIGRDALFEVSSKLLEYNLPDAEEDVPDGLRHGSRKLPLGRYLRRELRSMVGRDKAAPEVTLAKMEEELRPVYEFAKDAAKDAPRMVRQEIERAYFAEKLVELGNGAFNRMVGRPKRGRKL